jgi:hypothetical protein
MIVRSHAFEIASMKDVVSEHAQDIQTWSGWLLDGKGDAQAICRHVMGFSIWNACALLVLRREEAQAVRYFRQALAYGLIGLEPPAISIADYSSVFTLAVCFGDRTEMDEIARYPEDRYRDANVIATEDVSGYFRAWKHLLLKDEVRAKREMQEALTESPNAESRKEMEAFVSLVERDERALRTHIDDRLNAHGKRYQQTPEDPEGIICFPVLMLCRVAIDRGMVFGEWPYAPLSLLPNYKPTVH